jgi:acetoin utilization protein AcuB
LVAKSILDVGGNIISLGTFLGEDLTNRLLTVKVDQVSQDVLVAKMKEIGAQIIDVRLCSNYEAC